MTPEILTAVAREFGTPTYIYDLDRIRYQYKTFASAFSRGRLKIRYAMGGNYNLRPMPAEVVVENNEYRLSRKRLSPTQLVALITGESINNEPTIRTDAA